MSIQCVNKDGIVTSKSSLGNSVNFYGGDMAYATIGDTVLISSAAIRKKWPQRGEYTVDTIRNLSLKHRQDMYIRQKSR